MIIALASPGIASTLDEGLDKIKRFLAEAAAQLTFRTPRMAIHVFFQGGILRTPSYPQPWYVGIA